LIESTKSSWFDAEFNMADRKSSVFRGEVGRWSPGPRDSIDVVVADPARPGLGKPGVASLVASNPGVLVLVSCDPVSLARDVTLLQSAGFRPERVEVLDLYPNTHHVETVTRFVPETA
ncbi:MAG: class I SAM-dependent RNA methyltransferase, partial [Actinobacteria bacterium]